MKKINFKLIALAALLVITFALSACSKAKDPSVLKVGASPSPHAEILAIVKPILAEKGITLEITEYSDYVLPNLSLADGSLDANYFQHEPYLLDFNAGNGTDLIAASFVHYEPMGLYPGKTLTIDALPEGGKIAVPNDATNEARALQLLEAQGIITLPKDKSVATTARDIVENPLNLEFLEVEASQTPAVLPDVDFAVVNSNFALSAGIIETAIAREDENSVAVDFANVIAVRSGDETRPEIIALLEALKSPEVEAFINEKYKGAVVVFKG